MARIAGITAAKRTSELIPLCHNGVGLSGVRVDVEAIEGGEGGKHGGVSITATVECIGSTGVEMEALTAVSIAGLAVVDMCKSVDRGMVMGDVRVLEKRGGVRGDYFWDAAKREGEVCGEEKGGKEGGKWEGGVKVEGVGIGEMGRGWRSARDKAGQVADGHAGEYDWDWD